MEDAYGSPSRPTGLRSAKPVVPISDSPDSSCAHDHRAVVDYKYKKAGGQRPSKSDRIFMLVVTLFVIGLIASLYTVNVAIAGMAAVPLMLFLLFAWEVGRWRMRRKYPLPKPEADIAKTG